MPQLIELQILPLPSLLGADLEPHILDQGDNVSKQSDDVVCNGDRIRVLTQYVGEACKIMRLPNGTTVYQKHIFHNPPSQTRI
jgi:hypothetical protein